MKAAMNSKWEKVFLLYGCFYEYPIMIITESVSLYNNVTNHFWSVSLAVVLLGIVAAIVLASQVSWS
jgi:hypothetical protein